MYSDDDSELQEKRDNTSFYQNNKVLILVFLIIIIFIIGITVLKKETSVTDDKKYEIEITNLSENSIEITKGTIYTLKGKVSNDPSAILKWSSADESIAKVDNGAVTGVNYGKTTITAIYVDNNEIEHSISKEVIITTGDPNVQLQNVSFKDGDLFMPVGATYQIALTLNPSTGHVESKKFTSSNQNVVVVDNDGIVTSINEGMAVISVSVNDGLFSKELKVYVNNDYKRTEIIVTPDVLKFDSDLRKIKVGIKEKLTLAVSPQDVDQGKFDWKSSDSSVVEVLDDGFIKGVSEGRATITVTAMNGISDRIDVEVESSIVGVKDINLSITDLTLNVGQSQDITPVIIPDNASNKALSYLSMDNSIVTIVGNGTGTTATITGISVGTTTIIMRSNNNIEKKLNVTVIDPNPTTPTPSLSPIDTQGFKISSKDTEGYGYVNATYEKTKPANNGAIGPVTINIEVTDPQTSYLKVLVCEYTSVKCNPDISSDTHQITGSGSFTINNIGEFIIRVWRYNSNNEKIGEMDKFIWIKSSVSTSPVPNACDTCIKACLNNGGKDSMVCRQSSSCQNVC